MVCKKCGYTQAKEVVVFGTPLCSICGLLAPRDLEQFQRYLSLKVDWKVLEPYRMFSSQLGVRRKEGMRRLAMKGKVISRAAWGYDIREGKLIPNAQASSVYLLFKTFLEKEYSLNQLAKAFGLSVNGVKKVLTNRTYVGEMKFSGQIFRGHHKPLLSPDLFYAVQRKLEAYLKEGKR